MAVQTSFFLFLGGVGVGGLCLYGAISPLSFTSSSTILEVKKQICKTYSKGCSSTAKGYSISKFNLTINLVNA